MFPTLRKQSYGIPLKEYLSFTRPPTLSIIVLTGAILTLSACGFGGAQADEGLEPFQIRKPQPTFTPTPLGATGEGDTGSQQSGSQPGASTAGTDQSLSESTGAGESTSSTDAAVIEDGTDSDSGGQEGGSPVADPNFAGSQAIITSALVNGRGGPGTEYDVVGIVAENEIFDVLGQNDAGDWWHLCCYLGEEFWAIDQFLEIRLSANAAGSTVAQAPAQAPTQAPAQAPAQPAAAPISAAPEPAAPTEPEPVGDFAFDLVVQEQFSEQSVVRVFLYVFSDQVQALEGYSLQVTKDGTALSVGSKSYGPQAGFTWPLATTRQRFENMKVEFPNESPGGTWVLQLVDGSGKLVGPPATFDLSGNDPNQELYVRYKQK